MAHGLGLSSRCRRWLLTIGCTAFISPFHASSSFSSSAKLISFHPSCFVVHVQHRCVFCLTSATKFFSFASRHRRLKLASATSKSACYMHVASSVIIVVGCPLLVVASSTSSSQLVAASDFNSLSCLLSSAVVCSKLTVGSRCYLRRPQSVIVLCPSLLSVPACFCRDSATPASSPINVLVPVAATVSVVHVPFSIASATLLCFLPSPSIPAHHHHRRFCLPSSPCFFNSSSALSLQLLSSASLRSSRRFCSSIACPSSLCLAVLLQLLSSITVHHHFGRGFFMQLLPCPSTLPMLTSQPRLHSLVSTVHQLPTPRLLSVCVSLFLLMLMVKCDLLAACVCCLSQPI